MKRVLFFYNPKNGKSIFINYLDEIIYTCHKLGFSPSFYRISREMEPKNIYPYISDYDIIIISGGDGTINNIINDLINYDINIPVGIIPTGTANDFATAIGLKTDPVTTTEKLLQGKVNHIDIGQVNNKFFVNETGAGMLTAISQEVSNEIKNRLGKTGYYLKGLEKIWKNSSIPITVECEEFTIEREIALILVANSPIVGSFKNIVPASINDGLLDLIILQKCTIDQLIYLLIQAFKGRGEHLTSPLVEHYRSKWFKITSPVQNVEANIDGEGGVRLPLDISVRPKSLKLILPN